MDRTSKIIRTSVVGVVVNVLLATFKAAVGAIAGSVAIIMDAVNNLSDVLSSLITIVGAKLSTKPADREHPFGHGRIEYFSAIIIAIIVLFAGVTSFVESVKKIIEPTDPVYTKTTLIVVSVAIVVKILLGRFVKRRGEELKSDALIASGSDALFDAAITLSTLISAAIMLIWNISIDGYLGTAISCVILKAGFEMLASPVNELLGARISPELVSQLKQDVLNVEGVHGVFDIILHNYGPNVIIGSLHINVYDTMDAHQIHGLTRCISEMVYAKYGIILTIGVYAVSTGNNKRTELQTCVMQALAKHKEIVQVHGFYYFEKQNRVSVDIVPDISVKDEAALEAKLTSELKALLPAGMEITVIVDHNYSA